jgi:hypothetical protein
LIPGWFDTVTLNPQLERNRAGLEACIAFGEAWLSCHQIRESVARAIPISDVTSALIAELDVSQSQLSLLFEEGAHAAVCELSLSIMILCERIDLDLN